MSSNSEIPAIRTFQMDASSVGSLRSSVNLFRGDVNFTETLFTLPGKREGDGLDVEVSLQYQSNVQQEVMTWNRDRATGIVGLGWNLSAASITLEDASTVTTGTKSYVYRANSNGGKLVREPVNPVLFDMDTSLIGQLADGQQVPAGVRSEFVQRGLALSPTSITRSSGELWTIDDGERQQQFQLEEFEGQWKAMDGGESYQLANYNFWKFIYYPTYERWAVTTNTGSQHSFGGLAEPTPQGDKASIGNSIEWGVCWLSDSDRPLWIGSSTQVDRQAQYARTWHIARTYNVWGDYVSYGYNEPDDNGELIPGIEQEVGSGGKLYTKACYLTSLTDVFGRKATFRYGEKLWVEGGQREYFDPHKETPDNTPSAYQDQYETHYLDSIHVADQDAEPLFSVQLTYDVVNLAEDSGEFAKRLLTGLAIHNADGLSLPGFVFEYALSIDTSPNVGALHSILWPTGGQATYSYESVPLERCNRSYEATPPASMDATSSQPRVWFGPDYAVIMWHGPVDGKLSLQIATWTGEWKVWQMGDALLKSGQVDPETLTVVAGEEFVAISLEASDQAELFLYRKDPARPAQWLPAEVQDGGTGGLDSPTWSYSSSNQETHLMAGSSFIVVSQTDRLSGKGHYDVFSWNWAERSWTRESRPFDTFTIVTTGPEFYATVNLDGLLSFSYRAPTLEWRAGEAINLGFTANDPQSLAIQVGPGVAAVCHLVSQSSSSNHYDLFAIRWDEQYQLAEPSMHSYQDELAKENPSTWHPTIVSSSMISVAGHLLRFNGQQWLANDSLAPIDIHDDWQQRYAYGEDYAVLVHVDTTFDKAEEAKILAFDPNTASGSWVSVPTDIDGLDAPQHHGESANWPVSGDDYLVVGDLLFFRGQNSDWSQSVGTSVADLQSLIDDAAGGDQYLLSSQAMMNQGPAFLAASVFDLQGPETHGAVATLANGTVRKAQVLTDQRIWTQQEGGSPQGHEPGGPGAFASYPDTYESFDHADSFFVHRYAGHAITGAIEHYAVTALTLDDGLAGDASTTTFALEQETASCDPAGETVKYYKNTVYPCGSEVDHPFGCVENQYLNGAEIITGENFYNLLDGMLHTVTTKDKNGNELSRVISRYEAWAERAAHPTDGSAGIRPLYGAYVLPSGEDTFEDGVESSSTISYLPPGLTAPFTGQPALKSRQNLPDEQEMLELRITYACEVDARCRVSNQLAAVASQTAALRHNNGPAEVVSASATSRVGWPSLWGEEVLVASEESEFAWVEGSSDFPFSSYTVGTTPDGWTRNNRIVSRVLDGATTERRDGAGVAETTLFSETSSLPVARFAAAGAQECAYLSFESYEDAGAWTLASVSIEVGDAHTGEQCGRLPQGVNASISTSVTLATGRTTAVLGFWYQTPASYDGQGSGWQIAGGISPMSCPFEDTGGAWVYRTVGIPVDDSVDSLVTATASNVGNGDVLLDGLVLMPLGSELMAYSWHPERRLLASSTDLGGRTLRTLYDSFNRPIGSVGADGQLQELSLRFASRLGSADGLFDAAAPNAELTVHGADHGVAESFLDGDVWKTRWAVGQVGSWSRSRGSLIFDGAQSDTLRWEGWPTSPTTACFFAEILPEQDLAAPIAFGFGDGHSISWRPDEGWTWTDGGNVTVQSPLAQPPVVASQWLLFLAADGLVQFYGDGQLLFSQQAGCEPSHGFSLGTGANPLRIRNLAAMAAPRLGISYFDGGRRQRQVHQLQGADCRIMEIIYDGLDRQIASTRVAPGSFGSGAAAAPMQFRSTFVDVPAFLEARQSTWAMTGDVTDYYRGQADGAVPRSDDQGYAYTGIRYEDSCRDRQIENGEPGLDLAIHDIDNIDAVDRWTVRTRYGASDASDPLPAGSYFARTTTSAGGAHGRSLSDQAGRLVSSRQFASSGAVMSESSVELSQAGGQTGLNCELQLPNALIDGPQSNPESYTREQIQNPLSQVVEVTDCDRGSVRYLHDGKGNIRFTQPALEATECYFLYNRYDRLGRLIEEGYVEESWDSESLKAVLDDPSWPPPDQAKVSRSYSYDGDGNSASLLGKLIATETSNTDPIDDSACTVRESWEYDDRGRVSSATMIVESAELSQRRSRSARERRAQRTRRRRAGRGVKQQAAVRYFYNNLDELIEVRFSGELASATPAVVYRLDDQGQICSIGTSAETPDDIATYTYNADGGLETAILGSQQKTWAYDSCGRLIDHQVIVAGNPVYASANGYDPDGLVTHRQRDFSFSSHADQHKIDIDYDDLRRLSAVTVDGGHLGNESISAYDANGNIWAGKEDGRDFSGNIAAGSNRLESAVLPDGSSVDFQYRNDGRPSQWRGVGLRYHLGTGALLAAETTSPVRFAYGINNHQIVRREEDSIRIQFYGAGDTPLVTFRDGVATTSIWGPDGLVALHDGALRYPISDQQDTVWAWMSAGGDLLARYDYYPFGGLIETPFPGTFQWPARFMGKEYDETLEWYDFGARTYDPALRRFVGPDPARQYASPYVFVGNCPLSFTDPSGNISVWAQVGIGVAMVAVAVAGIALTPVSGGASAGAAAAVDASLAGAAVAEAGAAAAAVGAEVAAEAAAEVLGAGIAEAAAGATAAETAVAATEASSAAVANGIRTGLRKVGSVMAGAKADIAYLAKNVGCGAISGSGFSGLTYDATHGDDFTAAGFFRAMGLGAAGGAVGGLGAIATTPALASAMASKTITQQIMIRMAASGTTSMIGADVKSILTDVTSGEKITAASLLLASAKGFASGAVSGGLSGILDIRPDAAAVTSLEHKMVRVSTKLNKAKDLAKSVPTPQTAFARYMLGGGYSLQAYAAWGQTFAKSLA